MDRVEYGKTVNENSQELAGIAACIKDLANAFFRTGQCFVGEELLLHAESIDRLAGDISKNHSKHVSHEFNASQRQIGETIKACLNASINAK